MSDFIPMSLLTPRLVLRELEESDAAAAHEYERQEEVVRYVTYDVRTLEESRAYIRDSRGAARETPRQVFDLAVTLRENGRYIGRAGMKLTNAKEREAMLWYILDPTAWGRGYGPEAARAVMDFGFESLGLHRIFIDLDPRNTNSARVGEKLGMRYEAHLRENVFVKGEWADTMIYAILDHEWRAQRTAKAT